MTELHCYLGAHDPDEARTLEEWAARARALDEALGVDRSRREVPLRFQSAKCPRCADDVLHHGHLCDGCRFGNGAVCSC